MAEQLEWFNVAEVDILTDLLILDRLSGWPHNQVAEFTVEELVLYH